jgi:signal transduction histidine kinase
MQLSFSRRLSLVLALLLCGFGLLVGLVGHAVLIKQEMETLQSLSQGLAKHIVEHWPSVTHSSNSAAERRALDEVLGMLMVVNPAIEVYVLDSQGRVRAYLGDPKAVLLAQVDLAPIRAFLGGAALPLLGSDPQDSGPGKKIFSAAMFPPRPGDNAPPGYLYVVLEGQARAQVAGHIGRQRVWQSLALLLGVALLITLTLGLSLFHRLTQPLRQLALRMQAFGPGAGQPLTSGPTSALDEVQAISASFQVMADRIDRQLIEQAAAQAEHREVVANVAHDLRTPLTALHGHLEALERLGSGTPPEVSRRHLGIALAQSNKVRRLSQQLFELASLQSSQQVLQVEPFRLDELLTDAVQKFSYSADAPAVALGGPPPGPVELRGDLHLIERALSNLIDNALRHAPSEQPIQVSLHCETDQVTVIVEDHGPGLPFELARRLDCGQGVREPLIARPGGGFGGLGLAIAQRIATLHGGSLSTRSSSHGGTILCLALPLAPV